MELEPLRDALAEHHDSERKAVSGEPPGDLLLDIQVVLPSAESPHARVLYETMARDLAFDPRRETQGSDHG